MYVNNYTRAVVDWSVACERRRARESAARADACERRRVVCAVMAGVIAARELDDCPDCVDASERNDHREFIFDQLMTGA